MWSTTPSHFLVLPLAFQLSFAKAVNSRFSIAVPITCCFTYILLVFSNALKDCWLFAALAPSGRLFKKLKTMSAHWENNIWRCWLMAKEGERNWYPINRSILLNCLVGKFSFAILMRQHHERNIKLVTASKQFSGAMTSLYRKILQNSFSVGTILWIFLHRSAAWKSTQKCAATQGEGGGLGLEQRKIRRPPVYSSMPQSGSFFM